MFNPDKFSELLDAPVSRPDPKSIQGLIAWLETKDPREEYCYLESGSCLYSQYGKFLGFGMGCEAYGNYLQFVSGKKYPNVSDEPFRDQFGPYKNVAQGGDRTFGAALERAHEWAEADRARAYAASQVAV